MLDGIKEEAVGFLFNLEVQVEEAPAPDESPSIEVGVNPVPLPTADSHVGIRAKGLGGSRSSHALQYSAPAIDGEAGAGGVVVEREQAPALGVGGSANGGSGTNGRARSGSASG